MASMVVPKRSWLSPNSTFPVVHSLSIRAAANRNEVQRASFRIRCHNGVQLDRYACKSQAEAARPILLCRRGGCRLQHGGL